MEPSGGFTAFWEMRRFSRCRNSSRSRETRSSGAIRDRGLRARRLDSFADVQFLETPDPDWIVALRRDCLDGRARSAHPRNTRRSVEHRIPANGLFIREGVAAC